MESETLQVTMRLALATTSVLILAGLPLAYWLAKGSGRLRGLVDALVTLPLVLPPTVLGFFLLVALSPSHPPGEWLAQATGWSIPFSFAGIWIASLISNLPFAIRPMTAAFAGVDRRYVEASWCLGESRLMTFLRVVCPLAWPGIVTATVLTFAHTIGEFGVILMLGGNIPGVTRTLALAIYDDVQALDYASAGRASLVLVGFSFGALCLTHFLLRQKWAHTH